MKVKMLTKMAGPAGSHAPGDVIDVSASTAADLIGGGFALRVDEAPAPIERAAIAPDETRAIMVGDKGPEVITGQPKHMKRKR